MLKFADCLAAGFLFLLFVSVYRKRSSAAVRFWMVGWGFVLLHFLSLAWHSDNANVQAVVDTSALMTLLLCGTAFAVSYSGSNASGKTQLQTSCLLGLPWLLTALCLAALPDASRIPEIALVLSLVCTGVACGRLAGFRSLRFFAGVLLILGCGAWLFTAWSQDPPATVSAVLLTLCFGLNAVLISGRAPRLSAASLTMTLGAISWSLVWVVSSLMDRLDTHMAVSPEVWNLPKYVLAIGMLLILLDEEIRAAERASARYRLLFEANPHPMWIYEPQSLRFLEVNEAAVAHYGYSRDALKAMTLPQIVMVGDDPDLLQELRTDEAQQLSGPWIHRRHDGSEFPVDIASHPLDMEGHRATFALMHDITEPQRLHAQLLRQAHHDVLTGLPNRGFFEQTLKDALESAEASGKMVALFCIDLDRFKQINDTYGHSAGDRCLCALAERVTARLQGVGTLARTGGDEFMLMLGNLEHAATAEHLATLLLYDLKHPLRLESAEVELVVSVGIAVYPEDGQSYAQLWRDADSAMYRAKRAGGGQWVRVSREISRLANEANEIEHALRKVLKSGNLELFYQPQMTTSGELHCLEALVRFKDPLLSTMSAERVIGIAEESGLIIALGEWVLEEVCRQSRQWMDEGLRPVQIALNLSPIQLNRLNFSLKVASTLERFRLTPQMLEFEVTESTVMPDRSAASDQIALLARMGIRFSVDDFGTGYSSLGRLHQLPVEALKIDSSFIRAIGDRNGTYPTVRAIIALAHTFGLQVVGEGVETPEQLRILQALKCDRVQGFLFSRPIPAVDVRRFLEQRTAEAALEARSA